MRLHLVGIFNTVHAPQFSQCAFTGKCMRFATMMQPLGYEIVEYCNEGSESESAEKVTILAEKEFKKLRTLYDKEYPGVLAHVNSEIYRQFNTKLIKEMRKRVKPGEIILHPLGSAHSSLGGIFNESYHVEPGVGYPNPFFSYRVYESYAWWHFHQGKEDRTGSNYEWVIPMAYNLDEWEPNYEPGEYILFFGRICKEKGLDIIKEIARNTDREVIICGGGDASPWLDPEIPNLIYKKPVTGLARSDLLRNAYCMLMPTVYPEPFGSSAIESLLCGTPVLTPDYGGFTETIKQGVNGYRCKILGDWLYAIDAAGKLDRKRISDMTRQKYSMERLGKLHDKVYKQVATLKEKGWFTTEPIMAVPDWEPF